MCECRLVHRRLTCKLLMPQGCRIDCRPVRLTILLGRCGCLCLRCMLSKIEAQGIFDKMLMTSRYWCPSCLSLSSYAWQLYTHFVRPVLSIPQRLMIWIPHSTSYLFSLLVASPPFADRRFPHVATLCDSTLYTPTTILVNFGFFKIRSRDHP